MSEDTPEVKSEKKGWESVVLRILKWTAILGVLVFILFTILSRLGGNSDVLRTAIEDFLTQNTPYTARVARLNNMNFFPDIIIDVENVELRGGEDGLGEAEVRIGAAKFAVGFFDVAFGRDGFKAFEVQHLSARPGSLMEQLVELETVSVRDDEQGAALHAKGTIGPAALDAVIGLQATGVQGKRVYVFEDQQGFEVSLADVKISGVISDDLLGDLKLQDLKIGLGEQAVMDGNFELDRKGKGRFGLKGQGVLEPNKTALDLDIVMDFSAKPKAIGGRIKSETLQVGDVAAQAPLMKTINALNAVFGSDKDSLDLSGTALDLQLDVEALKAGELNWGSLQTPITLQESALNIGPLEGDISGGALSGDITLTSAEAPAKLESKIVVKGFDYAALQKQTLEEAAEIEGRGDILVNVSSKGASMDQILKGLSGKANLVGGRGTMNSGLLDVWGGGLLNALLPNFEEQNSLNVNCVVVNMDIEGLTARSDAVFVDTQKVTLQGEGTYDFAADQMEMVLEPKPKDVALGDISSAVNVSGPLSDLSVTPNVFDLGKKVGGLLLGAVNPVFYAVTLADLGLNDDHPCKAFVIERETLDAPDVQEEPEEEQPAEEEGSVPEGNE